MCVARRVKTAKNIIIMESFSSPKNGEIKITHSPSGAAAAAAKEDLGIYRMCIGSY